MSSMLEIRKLAVDYNAGHSGVHALNNVNLDLKRGEVLSVVGESGCGKSTLGLSIIGLLPRSASVHTGSILFHGTDLLRLDKEELRQIRGKKIAMIFQDPMTTLNPVESIQEHMLEVLHDHKATPTFSEGQEKIRSALAAVGISPERLKDFPHQLSGGMRQRVMTALALLLNREVLIADEPTTSLDVLIEAQILDMFNDLKKKYGLSIIFITHNFGVVAQIADRVAVMYAGELVEVSQVNELFKEPLHPYTEALLKCVPDITDLSRAIKPIAGHPPELTQIEDACAFRTRCPYAFERCNREKPMLTSHSAEHLVACHLRN